jgi:hypothetical protein
VDPFSVCGCRKFQFGPLGDHLCTCTTHSGAKEVHDWEVDQVADLFRTTHRVKTQTGSSMWGLCIGGLPCKCSGSVGPRPPLENIVLTIIRILHMLSPSYLLLLVRLEVYVVNLCDFYFFKLIRKLTTFLQVQEFRLRIQMVDFSTTSTWCSPPS